MGARAVLSRFDADSAGKSRAFASAERMNT
jgi:hypothetical protein